MTRDEHVEACAWADKLMYKMSSSWFDDDAGDGIIVPRDPERDLATDPADEEARRWERELARADVARRDP